MTPSLYMLPWAHPSLPYTCHTFIFLHNELFIPDCVVEDASIHSFPNPRALFYDKAYCVEFSCSILRSFLIPILSNVL